MLSTTRVENLCLVTRLWRFLVMGFPPLWAILLLYTEALSLLWQKLNAGKRGEMMATRSAILIVIVIGLAEFLEVEYRASSVFTITFMFFCIDFLLELAIRRLAEE